MLLQQKISESDFDLQVIKPISEVDVNLDLDWKKIETFLAREFERMNVNDGGLIKVEEIYIRLHNATWSLNIKLFIYQIKVTMFEIP